MPIIERDFLPDGAGKERNCPSKTLVFAAILIAVLMLGAIAGLMVQIVNDEGQHPSETPMGTRAGILYTAHSPISINGNGEFTIANGVVSGIGTASDPYIIADWDINASAANGISITATDAHFIIRNCHVHSGSPDWIGVYLSGCFNGTLENNNLSSDSKGVHMDSSSNMTLNSNNCSSNYADGIYLSYASNNTLSGNTCSNNGFGMYLGLSNYNTIVNNNCNLNVNDGMYLDSSNNNTLSNNNCSNGGGGITFYFSNGNTLSNNNCSSNRNYGMIAGTFSSNNTLYNNTCNSNNYSGIALVLSYDNNLSRNTCDSNKDFGIFLNPADNNTISLNQIRNNSGYGVSIYSGSENRIWNNTFIGNNGATDTYDMSHVQSLDDGSHNWWNSTKGYGNYWSDWQSPDNVPPYGIVDLPYSIDGTASAQDSYPLTTPAAPIPEFGMMPLVVMALMAVIVLAGETRQKKP